MESEVSVFLCEVYDKKIRGILFSYGGTRNLEDGRKKLKTIYFLT